MKSSKCLLTLSIPFFLSSCISSGLNFSLVKQPEKWSSAQDLNIQVADIKALKEWWKRFNDPALNALVDMSLIDSPDRKIAMTRIIEARGVRLTSRSALFPEIGVSAESGRQDNGLGTADYYQAGFDASFEIDVFGVNRNNLDAANSIITSLQAEYHDVSLTLIAEVARVYADYRAAQKKIVIAQKNLDIQTKTLSLIQQQYNIGEIPLLDVERSEALVNTTRASIPEFERLADNSKLQLTVLTGALPDEIMAILSKHEATDIANLNIDPLLSSPASVIRLRPDVQAAVANMNAQTSLAKSAVASIFPTFSLSGFYGIGKSAVTSSTNIWSLAAGTAVSLLNFSRIEGQINAAEAREVQAFELYRKTILEAVVEVETALSDYQSYSAQYTSIAKSYNNANNALSLSQGLYREGEISFIDLLDAQRTVNDAELSLINSQQSQVQSVIRLHKSLGVY